MARNINLLKAWIAALRSGKYHQVDGQLCEVRGNQTFHCCLGVACRVMHKNGVNIDMFNDGNNVLFDGEMCHLNNELRTELTITLDEQEKLVRMNDEDRASFREIADFIEDNILDTEPK